MLPDTAMSETSIARGNLPPRPLAVRARADAGLLGQYQRQARRRRLAGDADQRLARLARSGAAVAARPRRPAGLRRRPDQGSAAAHRAVPDPRRRARGGASAFDPFGGAVDAAGDRSPRRAAADDALLPDEMRRTPRWCRIIGRAIPRWPTPSRGSPENIHPCCSPITARWSRATRWKPRCSRSRNWKRRQSSICCCAG